MKPLYKILIALGTLILLGAAGYFIWWLFIAQPMPTETPASDVLPGDVTGNAPSTSTASQGSAYPVIRSLSDNAVFNYWRVGETGEIYYLTPEGRVYAVKEGPDLEISKQTISALNRVEPSRDGRRLLASFGNPLAPQWGIFDTADSVWRPLPSQITNAGWGRTSSELVATVVSGNDTNLSFVDIAKTPPTYTVLVRDFRIEDAVFSLLNQNELLIVEKPSAEYAGNAWRFNFANRAFTRAFAPAQGLTIAVSPSGAATYLFETIEEFSIGDAAFANRLTGLFTTLPSKCADYASTTYCFVPQNPPSKTVLPDDYFMRKFYSIDSLYRVDLATGAIDLIVLAGEQEYDADSVHATENALYFINRYDNLLYKLEIK